MQKNGYKANIFEGQPEGKKYLWNIVTVSKIHQNEIYLGNTVHYQIQKLSYKSKKNVKRPKEDWMRIENTHEPLVDRETWDLVQGHINSRKRSQKDDEPRIFAGLLKCGECGWSLSVANTKNKSRYYRYTQYSAHGKEACSLHFITYNLLYAFVLERLQYWLMAVKKNEDVILERLLQSSEKQRRSENARDEKELRKAQKRRQELNNLFAKMYEDRVKGFLTKKTIPCFPSNTARSSHSLMKR